MPDNIADLESYVRDWAWNNRLGFNYYNQDDLKLEVNMDKVDFAFDKPTFSHQRKSSTPDSRVVFKTNYTNNTNENQEVVIKATRQTSSTALARVKHGFTADYKCGIRLRLPQDVQSTFDGDIETTAEEEKRLEKKTTWTFNSKITAAPRRTTVARFEVNVESLSCEFSTYAHLKGTVSIKVLEKQTGACLMTVKEKIRTILSEYLPRADDDYPYKENIVLIAPDCIKWPFRGTLDFNYGISQNEVVE